MKAQSVRAIRHALALLGVLFASLMTGGAVAAPYAAMVMDARNGEVIFARNHDTRLHPASLTKMMTLYVAFEAVKHGEVTLDTQFTVSRRATQVTCVCLGLRPGQKISLRYLIRAAALRSANDASIVIAEGISGSVEAFAERMTRTARAMGMSNTTFLNPHGLTQTGHVSTARDMTILGRQLYFDYPQYYNIFSRRSDHAGVATVPNTNRRFLDAYAGADGIKTGYTRAAGFNLTASAKRGGKHIIATMFGGSSTAARNAHVAELLDIGFSRAGARVATSAPRTPAYQGRAGVAVAQAPSSTSNTEARTIRLQTAVQRSLRPAQRPLRAPDDAVLLAVRQSVDAVVLDLAAAPESASPETISPVIASLSPGSLVSAPPSRPEGLVPERRPSEAATIGYVPTPPSPETDIAVALAAGFRMADPEVTDPLSSPDAPVIDVFPSTEASLVPVHRPEGLVIEPAAETDLAVMQAQEPASIAEAPQAEVQMVVRDQAAPASSSVPAGIVLTSTPPSSGRGGESTSAIAAVAEAQVAAQPESRGEIVPRLSTSDGGRLWGVTVGHFNSRAAAERNLITVKMAEASSLANGVSRIRQASGQFEAGFAGLTQAEAERACLRLQARSMECNLAHP